MAQAFNDLGEVNLDEIMRIAQGGGGFYESPKTAQETLMRGQEQHRDLALNFLRQMLDVRGAAEERTLAAKGGQERETIGAKAQFDPIAQVTAGVGRGESLEGNTMSDLMQIIFGKQGMGNVMGKMAGIEAQGKRQASQQRVQLIMQANNQIAKLEEPDESDEKDVARYKRQVSAIQKRLKDSLGQLDAGGGAPAAGGGDRRSRLLEILGGQGQQAADPLQQFYEQYGQGQPALGGDMNDMVARILSRYPLDLEAPQE